MRTRVSVAVGVGVALAGLIVLTTPQAAQAACTQRRPKVTLTPDSRTVAPGATATYKVKVKNQDGRGCPATTFLIQATHFGSNLDLEFWVESGNYEWRTLAPQKSATLTVRAVAAAGAVPATHEGSVNAADFGHPNHLGAALIEAVIQ
jgi:hypothetical protein